MMRGVTVLGYAVIALCAVALEVGARAGHRMSTFGQALASGLRRPPLRVVLLAGWLWVGWHVFVRVDWR
jgi:hypothetical protein